MSFFHDQYFEARINWVQAREDAADAHYRQKEIDEAQEAEHKAMLDADEAAHAWLDTELEIIARPTSVEEAEAMLNKSLGEMKAAIARAAELMECMDARWEAITKESEDLKEEIQLFKDSMTAEDLERLRLYFSTSKSVAA